jgi:WD40 repeat protein
MMQKQHFSVVGLLLVCLLFSVGGCLSTEALPTQDIGLTTPTQKPINTAPIQNTNTPQPTPTVPASSLQPQLQTLCAAAFAGTAPVSNTASLPAPFISSIYRTYESMYRVTMRWVYEQTLGQLETRDASQVATLVCIQENSVKQGEYQDGSPAYRLDWEVRFLRWPDGAQLASWTKKGSIVPGIILSGESAGYGEPPLDELLQYLASTSDNRSLIFLENAVSGLAFSPDGQVLYISETAPEVSSYTGGAEEMGIWVWNLAEWKGDQHLGSPGHVAQVDTINAFALSASGQRVAAGRWSGLVQVWDTSSFSLVAQFQMGRKGFYGLVGLAFSPDEELLAGLVDDKIMVWKVSTQELLWQKSVVTRPERTAGLAFQADGQAVAVCVLNDTVLFSSMAGASLGRAPVGGDYKQIIYTPDGKFLWVNSDYVKPYGYNLVGGPDPQLKPGVPESDHICSLTVSHDGTYLAAGSCKGEIVIWRTDTGEVLATLTGHRMEIWALAFTWDGKILASGSDDRSVRLWFAGSDYPAVP